MKKNGLKTGIIIGGVLGITASLLGRRILKGKASKNKEVDTETENIQLEPLSEKMEEAGGEKVSKGEKSKSIVIGKVKKKIGREETAEKTANLEVESRDTEREEEMKARMEGSSMMEDLAAKMNFSEKISQLEEALKKLREENTQ